MTRIKNVKNVFYIYEVNYTHLVHLGRVRREIHKLAYPVEQIRVPFFHQANVADRHFSEIPTRNVSQQLNAHEEKLTSQTRRAFKKCRTWPFSAIYLLHYLLWVSRLFVSFKVFLTYSILIGAVTMPQVG